MEVAEGIKDPRIVAEISRRFKERHEEKHFERLVQHYWHDQKRLLGMTRPEVEDIFGPLSGSNSYFMVNGGRDALQLWFEDGRVSGAFHVIGY